VKPLERCQLKNWKEYLDYEIEQGDQERIIILFERCLIACALYEEFWIKVGFIKTVYSYVMLIIHLFRHYHTPLWVGYYGLFKFHKTCAHTVNYGQSVGGTCNYAANSGQDFCL
jgi:hypothetical protein